MPRLSKSVVASLQPRASTYLARDTDLPGFVLRVTPAGSKSWAVEYRAGNGGRNARKRLFTIGSLATFGPEAARKAAATLLARVKLGEDPMSDRTVARAGATVAGLAEAFLDPKQGPILKPRTVKLYRGYLRTHILPAFGPRQAGEVNQSDVVRFHRKVGADAPPTANRCVALLGQIFAWSIGRRLVERQDNPARLPSQQKFAEQSRKRFLDTAEFARLGEALRLGVTVGLPYAVDEGRPTAKHAPKPENRLVKLDPHAAAAILLLILTGARLNEILHLEWSQVDFERGFASLPDSKTGQRDLMLNAPAVAVIARLPRIGRFVIAGATAGSKDERPRADLQRPWDAIKRHARLDGVRIHDLRHSHASVGISADIGLPLIGGLLGHTNERTTARYSHLADRSLRRASERIGAEITAAMTGGTQSGDPAEPGADR